MRKIVSKKLLFIKGFLFVLLGYIILTELYILLTISADNDPSTTYDGTVFGLPLFILILCVLLYLLFRLKEIRYDEAYCYIGSSRNPQIIPLENIKTLFKTRASAGDIYIWRMTLLKDGTESVISFVPKNNLDDFIQIIKRKNPEIVVDDIL